MRPLCGGCGVETDEHGDCSCPSGCPGPLKATASSFAQSYRVIITGSRTWCDAVPIYQALALLQATMGDRLLVVHGDCNTGADAIAEEICRLSLKKPIAQEKHPADWERYGDSAGRRRNAEMAELRGSLVLAFRDNGPSPGTDHMRRECLRRGLRGLWYTCKKGGIQIKPLDFDVLEDPES